MRLRIRINLNNVICSSWMRTYWASQNEYKLELHKKFTLLDLKENFESPFQWEMLRGPHQLLPIKSGCDVENHFGFDK